MVNNPLLSTLKEINPTLQFKSEQIKLPINLFQNKKEGIDFPKYNLMLPSIGIFSEYMIETIVNKYAEKKESKIKVEQYLKKNDFPDLVYDEHLYEVKTVYDYGEEMTKAEFRKFAQSRVVDAKKIQALKDGYIHNGTKIKGVFLMVCYYTMEKLDKNPQRCRMVINKIEFYTLDDGEKGEVRKNLKKLNDEIMKNSKVYLKQVIKKVKLEGVKELQNYILSVKESKAPKHGGN